MTEVSTHKLQISDSMQKKRIVWQMSDGGMKEIWKGKNWEIWQQFNNFIWQLWQQPLDTKSSCWDEKFWAAFF